QPSDCCFAKTDYTRQLLRELQGQVKTQRPNHACESVMLGRLLIGRSLGAGKEQPLLNRVLRAVCGAIARHHTPQASEYHEATLSPAALQAATDALALARQNAAWQYDVSALATKITEKHGDLAPAGQTPKITRPGDASLQDLLETWLYCVLVRALRLADQR